MLREKKVLKIVIAVIVVVGIIAAGIVIYNHSGKKESAKEVEQKETDNVVSDIPDDIVREGLFEGSVVAETSVYYYEGNTFQGKVKCSKDPQIINFFVELHPDGSFIWHDAMVSSFIGIGDYTIKDGILTLTNDLGLCGNEDVFKFWIYDDRLEFILEGSDEFNWVEVKDGERFFLGTNLLGKDWEVSMGESVFYASSYFVTQSPKFYKWLAENPIDEKYVVDYSSTTMEVKEALIKKCEAWNKQSDYTVSKLEGVLKETEYETIKNLVKLWREYYEEELGLNSALYGINGLIPGSMYSGISMDVLETKCRFTAYILLSYEYELTGSISFAEGEMSDNKTDGYEFSPESFCIEDVEEFKNIIKQYSLDEKDVDELKELIISTAGEINPIYKEHTKKYVKFIEGLYPIEFVLLNNEESCLSLEKNRLKLFATEILNIDYMIKQAKMMGE